MNGRLRLYWVGVTIAILVSAARAEPARLFRVEKDQKVGFINATGKLVIPLRLSPQTGEFADGVIVTPTARQKEATARFKGYSVTAAVWEWVRLDESGNEKVTLGSYHYVADFEAGIAQVANSAGFTGFIDKQGHEVIPCQYDGSIMVGRSEDVFAVLGKDGQKTSVFDFQGKELFQCSYGGLMIFKEGLALVSEPTSKFGKFRYGYINKSGRVVIPLEHDQGGSFSEGLTIVGTAHYRPPKSEPSEAEVEKLLREGKGIVIESGPVLTGYTATGLDTNGAVVFRGDFASWRVFSEGLAQVKVDEMWGYIDRSGKLAIKPQFENCGPFCEGIAAAKANGKWGFIEKDGSWLIEPQITIPKERERMDMKFSGGLVRVPGAKGCGYMDKTGNWVWPRP